MRDAALQVFANTSQQAPLRTASTLRTQGAKADELAELARLKQRGAQTQLKAFSSSTGVVSSSPCQKFSGYEPTDLHYDVAHMCFFLKKQIHTFKGLRPAKARGSKSVAAGQLTMPAAFGAAPIGTSRPKAPLANGIRGPTPGTWLYDCIVASRGLHGISHVKVTHSHTSTQTTVTLTCTRKDHLVKIKLAQICSQPVTELVVFNLGVLDTLHVLETRQVCNSRFVWQAAWRRAPWNMS